MLMYANSCLLMLILCHVWAALAGCIIKRNGKNIFSFIIASCNIYGVLKFTPISVPTLDQRSMIQLQIMYGCLLYKVQIFCVCNLSRNINQNLMGKSNCMGCNSKLLCLVHMVVVYLSDIIIFSISIFYYLSHNHDKGSTQVNMN